jgi:exoribonuclease-2
MARKSMIDAGFLPEPPAEVIEEVERLDERDVIARQGPSVRDLRDLLWSSIDNDDTRDLDQVEYAEGLADGEIRVMIGIADVDAFIPRGSATDRFAAANGTSVYTGIATFGMLPERLSTDLTSLMAGADRLAIVIDLIVDERGGVVRRDAYRALVRNRAQLAYGEVGAWLEGGGGARLAGGAPRLAALDDLPELAAQLGLQEVAASRLRAASIRNGALDFETIEARPVMYEGHVADLEVVEQNRARDVIESFMVAANSTMAAFLASRGIPSIRRRVHPPYRWGRIVEIAERLGDRLPREPDALALQEFLARRRRADPVHFPDLSLSVVKLLGPSEYAAELPDDNEEDHFSLAAHDYTHSTAPNRRYVDLVIQRLLKAGLAGEPQPYGFDELAAIAEQCTDRSSAARKVERLMRKAAAAEFLSGHIGEEFGAIVTGVSPKGTFVRLISPPAEGRVIRGEHGLDVGDRVRVRLVGTSAAQGFIDFERA